MALELELGVDDDSPIVLCSTCTRPALVEHAPGSSCGTAFCAIHAGGYICPGCGCLWIVEPKGSAA